MAKYFKDRNVHFLEVKCALFHFLEGKCTFSKWARKKFHFSEVKRFAQCAKCFFQSAKSRKQRAKYLSLMWISLISPDQRGEPSTRTRAALSPRSPRRNPLISNKQDQLWLLVRNPFDSCTTKQIGSCPSTDRYSWSTDQNTTSSEKSE